MKKITMLSLVLMFFCLTASAQKGNNQVGVGVDLGLPMGDFGKGAKMGLGGSVKGLYGVGQAGQVGLSVGYISFGMKNSTDKVKATSNIIPILATYRHHFNGLYVEPQLGLSMIKAKYKADVPVSGVGSVSGTNSTSGFGWAIGAGYLISDFDLSVRYQSSSADGGSLNFFGLRVGYNFSL